jgi:integrase
LARVLNRLSPLEVMRATAAGLYSDGGGLYLQVTPREGVPPAKSWVFRYRLNGRSREMGLGPLHTVSLAQARALATQCRQQCASGIDPIEAREIARRSAAAAVSKALTFRQCAKEYIEAHKASWRNKKHASQWEATLETYAYPKLGSLQPQAIGTPEVLSVLQPIWISKTETANRLRGRIELVLDYAKVHGYRDGDNPARWRGHLDKLLPPPNKVHKIKHHAALPYSELPEFIVKLRRQEGIAARALEFTILTAARTGEVIGARKPEISSDNAMWIVPAERMKAGVEHRVPLTARALQLTENASVTDSEFIFPGQDLKHGLSNMAMAAVLRRMGYEHITVHGFRSTFRDWAAEQTSYPGEVAEAALAHANGDKVEAAYLRADLFEKRRRLMDDWGEYCGSDRPVGAEVVPIRATARS